jgi:pimeloyl-ACP methyl ester carboxylesterase
LPHAFTAPDGARLVWHELGQGRPVLLLHGFMSSAQGNWFAPGIAKRLAEAGFRVIAPDCRGHGDSDAPTDPAAWPADIMAADALSLIAHLGLSDFDLAGYSMGGRTAARIMVRGARPGRCVIGGMGDFGIMEAGPRAAAFEDALRHGEDAADPVMGKAIAKRIAGLNLNREALLGVLAAFAPTFREDLAAIPVPTLAILGLADHDNGSVQGLADIMPACTPLRLPGDHAGLVGTTAFAEALTGFLTAKTL